MRKAMGFLMAIVVIATTHVAAQATIYCEENVVSENIAKENITEKNATGGSDTEKKAVGGSDTEGKDTGESVTSEKSIGEKTTSENDLTSKIDSQVGSAVTDYGADRPMNAGSTYIGEFHGFSIESGKSVESGYVSPDTVILMDMEEIPNSHSAILVDDMVYDGTTYRGNSTADYLSAHTLKVPNGRDVVNRFAAKDITKYSYIAECFELVINPNGYTTIPNSYKMGDVYIQRLMPIKYRVDESAPEVNIVDTVDEGDDARERFKYTNIILDAEDYQAGIGSMAYSFSLDEDEENYSDENKIRVERECTLYTRVRDAVGNVSVNTISVNGFDHTEPEISEVNITQIAPANSYCKNARIEVTALDRESGLHDNAFAIAMGEDVSAKDLVFSNRPSFSVSENGLYVVAVRDYCDNMVGKIVKISCIDNDGPTINITGNPSSKVAKDVKLTVSLSDEKSGLGSLWVQDDEVSYRSLLADYNGAKVAEYVIPVTRNGAYTVFASDKLGNMSKYAVKVTGIDKSHIKKSSSSSSVKRTGASSSQLNITYDKKKPIITGLDGKNIEDSSAVSKEIVLKGIDGPDSKGRIVIGDDIITDDDFDGDFKIYDSYELEDEKPYEDLSYEDYDASYGGTYYPADYEHIEVDYGDNKAQRSEEVNVESLSKGDEDTGISSVKIIAVGILVVLLLLALLIFLLIKLGIISIPEILKAVSSLRERFESENGDDTDDTEIM